MTTNRLTPARENEIRCVIADQCQLGYEVELLAEIDSLRGERGALIREKADLLDSLEEIASCAPMDSMAFKWAVRALEKAGVLCFNLRPQPSADGPEKER